MKIKTSILQNLVKKVYRSGVDKNLGITEYGAIQSVDGVLSIMTTDGVNHVKARVSGVEGGINAIVHLDTFNKIVSKTTKEYINLEMSTDCLLLTGNGVYKIPVYSGEDYPQPEYDKFNSIEGIKVGIDDLQSIIHVNKSAVSNSSSGGALRGYLITSDGVVTTDGIKACFNDRVKSPIPILVSREMLQLSNAITSLDVTIKYLEEDSLILIESDDMVIVGAELEGKEIFPDASDVLNNFKEKTNVCTVCRSVVLKALERVSLFISPYDEGELAVISEGNTLQFITFEDSYEDINITETQLEKVEVGVSSANLKDALVNLPVEQVELGFAGTSLITLEVPHVKIAVATVE